MTIGYSCGRPPEGHHMEYGIWSLHVAGELWGDPRLARRHPILPPNATQLLPRAALALSALHQPTNMVPLPLTLSGPPYGPMELVTKSSGSTNDLESVKDENNDNFRREDNDDGDDNEGNEENIEKPDENENQTSEQIENNENEDEEESDSGSTGSSHKSANNNFPTKLLDPISCLGLDKEGAVSPVLNGWVLGAYTAMLGRLSAATAALEATQIPNIPSDSDSESENSSYTERSRGSSPNGNNIHRGYSCGSCDVVAPTRPALRKHIADCHPTLNGTETRESRTCPASGCDFTTNSRCDMETHVAAHVAQGMTPTGKKRTLALQRVRYRYEREEYRCSLCSYACTIEKAFQRHLRAHARGTAPETRVSCAVCGADRSSEVDLSRHMRRHRDDRYFCCDICIFRTVQLKKLIQHRRMHTGEKPHLCPHCAYRSARRDNLRSHVRRVHKKENLYCDTFSPRGMLIAPTMNDKDDSIVVQSPASSPSSNPESTN
ncbi:PREDICTED: zinc finger and BTB domain-containing protein 41 isoform X1 [Polistes dominula]|uniref:Zinc finger and BTB domain-containing protein 41 isoform X1 n=2 Tax=Polistes dominula TaxID=743375 RepID=A0ABM1IV16_POLDO|nr:PREDICTED: zinc finger and BTB domain-containing protein 41 isoform X1 [Polistes dominula]XP_015184053.1 PREDICTED: zinc finger and BTB domain-containing protein 41 isoform X1 [Polistes dominula]